MISTRRRYGSYVSLNRIQMPFALSTDGEPEPDLLVVGGELDDYPEHPTQDDAVLILEVSDSTLAYDW